jgi:hypothetical protein
MEDGEGNLNRSQRRQPSEHCPLATKLEDYSLNPSHREGRHKARVFESVLGITPANAEVLRAAIRSAAATSDDVEARGDNGFGEAFNLRFAMVTRRGSATVLTAWIVLHNEDFPRLTTCYIV